MLLDIKKIFSGYDTVKRREAVFDFSNERFDACTIVSPVTFIVTTRLEGEAVRLTIEGNVTVEAECARCLKPVKQVIPVFREAFIQEDGMHAGEEDLPYAPDGRLDLYELCFTELVLAIPTILLCSEDCQGICPVCGKERSLGCACKEQEIDDRLAILSQLLTDE
ncbi:MAG: DUF177 domain-containing protein [Oscillospiraceae bacterium]|nr:DUF177 domain-containing protein [Oscillospiraceae bacterium]